MYQLFYTPSWFQGFDLVFDAISIVVALLVAGYSWKVYKLTSENKYGYFSFAFLLITIGLIAKVATYGILYFKPLRDVAAVVVGPAAGFELSLSYLWYRGAFFFQMASMLSAWLLLFFVSQKTRSRLKKFYEISQIALFLYLIMLVSFVSNFKYFVFYLTSAVMLGMTSLHYYKNYLNTEKKSAFLVMSSFLLLTFSQIFSVFVFVFESFYVLGELLLLMGFLLILYTYWSVIKK